MKTILITGASSGIGRALAIRAGRAGYAVYAVGRDAQALAALRARIEDERGIVATESLDIAKPEHAAGLVARTLARFDSLDVLVNNAGFVSAGPLSEQADDELQRQFGTHVLGPVALVREALTALRASRGHVFMLGSGVARIAVGGLGAYPPAKAAIRSATTILMRELAPQGIAVTYVDPGAVDTPFMTRAGMPGAPPNLLASPEAVARAILIAVGTRPRVVNAVPWQTSAVALAERLPNITEFVLARAPDLVGGGTPPAAPAHAHETDSVAASGTTAPAPAVLAVAQPDVVADDGAALDAAPEDVAAPLSPLDAALEPHRRRMEKLKLSESFVRGLLVPETELELGEIAMRWAGMPNKNERALTEEVAEALAAAGFLERLDEQRYRVVSGA